MIEKYGLVFLKRKVSNSTSYQLEQIPGIRFSNLDHKLYGSDGKMHQELDNFRGKSFSLRFTITQPDKNGNPIEYEGSFLLPYKLGEMDNQDFDGVAAAENEDFELLRRHNLISKDVTAEQVKRKMGQASFLAALYPGRKLTNFKLFRLFNLAFFTFDDQMEKLGADLKFDQFNYFLRCAFDIIDGKSVKLDDAPTATNLQNVLLKYLHLVQHLHIEISKAENQSDSGFYVREAFKEYLQGCCLESCSEWKEQKAMFEGAKKRLRIIVAATIVCFEMGLLDMQIQIKAEIRNTCLFKWFVELCAQHVCWVNDIVSYRKEMAAGQAGYDCNKVYKLHYNKGLQLAEAMQTVQNEANQNMDVIIETGRLLGRLYTDDESMQSVVKIVKDMVYGHTQWCVFQERYHKNFTYDCVMEEDQ